MPKRERNKMGQFAKKDGYSDPQPLFLRVDKVTIDRLRLTAKDLDITVSALIEKLVTDHSGCLPLISLTEVPKISKVKFGANQHRTSKGGTADLR